MKEALQEHYDLRNYDCRTVTFIKRVKTVTQNNCNAGYDHLSRAMCTVWCRPLTGLQDYSARTTGLRREGNCGHGRHKAAVSTLIVLTHLGNTRTANSCVGGSRLGVLETLNDHFVCLKTCHSINAQPASLL
jgi:hypothetical protein